MAQFYCGTCDLTSKAKCNHERHLESESHQRTARLLQRKAEEITQLMQTSIQTQVDEQILAKEAEFAEWKNRTMELMREKTEAMQQKLHAKEMELASKEETIAQLKAAPSAAVSRDIKPKAAAAEEPEKLANTMTVKRTPEMVAADREQRRLAKEEEDKNAELAKLKRDLAKIVDGDDIRKVTAKYEDSPHEEVRNHLNEYCIYLAMEAVDPSTRYEMAQNPKMNSIWNRFS